MWLLITGVSFHVYYCFIWCWAVKESILRIFNQEEQTAPLPSLVMCNNYFLPSTICETIKCRADVLKLFFAQH